MTGTETAVRILIACFSALLWIIVDSLRVGCQSEIRRRGSREPSCEVLAAINSIGLLYQIGTVSWYGLKGAVAAGEFLYDRVHPVSEDRSLAVEQDIDENEPLPEPEMDPRYINAAAWWPRSATK